MKDLLKRWAELEPSVCQVISASRDDGFKVKILPDLLGWHWIELTDGQLSLVESAVLQFAVQQAIEARDLNWAISFLVDESEPGYGGSQHTASVFTFGKRYVREGEISAAEAILSAYLKAVEARPAAEGRYIMKGSEAG